MGCHTLVSSPTQDIANISTFELLSLGIRGPKSVLATDLIQPGLAKSGFIRSLGLHLPVSKSGNRLWERYMLIHCFGSFFQAMFTYNPPPPGLGREWKEVKYIVCWTDYITVQSLLLRHLVKVSLSEPFFSFVACIVFISLLVFLPQYRERSLTFFSIFAMLLGEDIVHNSRISHLVYSLTPFTHFFPISHSFLAGSKRLIWDRKASPALCPTSTLSSLLFLLISFSQSFTSFHLSLNKSLSLLIISLFHSFTVAVTSHESDHSVWC